LTGPGLDQQRHVLHRSPPRLRPVDQVVHEPDPRSGSLWSRCHPRGRPLAPWRVGLAQDGPRHDGPAGACPARPDGLLGPLNAPSNPHVGLRDQEARRILAAAVGGTVVVAESGRVCVRVRPPGECVPFTKRLYQKPTRQRLWMEANRVPCAMAPRAAWLEASRNPSSPDPLCGVHLANLQGRATPRRCNCRNGSLPTTRCAF